MDPAYTGSSSASATGNLATGITGVAAGGNYLDRRFSTSGQDGGVGQASALLNDTLHFSIAGAFNSTITDILVTYSNDGMFSVPTPAGDSNGDVSINLHFGNAAAADPINSLGNSGYLPYTNSASQSG